MRKKKKGSGEWLPLIPVALVIIMIVTLVVWRNVDTDDPADTETLDTGQSIVDDGSDDVPSEDEDERLRQPPENIKIRCDQVAVYTGEFFESGKDEPVENVASMRVVNKSDKYLEYAELTYEVDGHTATFVVTGLPAGKAAWVLEKNGLQATNDSKFIYKDAVTAYRDHAVRAPEELEIKYGNKMLKVTNVTDAPLENVVIQYKVVHTDGSFLGGITYSVNFGTVQPGESIEKIAGHYVEDWTQIVRVSWMDDPSANGA